VSRRDLIDRVAQAILDRLTPNDDPIIYNDEGVAKLQRAAMDVWDEMDEATRQKLVDEAYRFMLRLLADE
jgi:hypothetical protein